MSKYTRKFTQSIHMYWNGFVFYDLSTNTCYDANGEVVVDPVVARKARRNYLYNRSVYCQPDFLRST